MQIKRFEAEDMTEALRLVKREFGDDAVILSAKETRPGGFFSAFRKKCVEITAATDYPLNDTNEDSDFSRQLSEQLDTESENDRVSLSLKSTAFVPLTARTNASAPPNELPQRGTLPDRIKERWSTHPPVATKAMVESDPAAVDERPQHRDAAPVAAEPFYRHLSQRRIIALVGGHGTGKSTAVAKLARHCRLVEKKTVALVSLDRFRIGANATLAKVSQIMNLPFATVRDADQLRNLLDERADVDVVLIDTPGMGRADASMMDDIARLLDTAKPDETHLVVNATVRKAVLDGWTRTFQPLGIDRLLLTHLDEDDVDDGVLELIRTHRLPSAFYTDGVDLFDHLKETPADGFALTRLTTPARPLPVADFPIPQRSAYAETDIGDDDGCGDDIHFVANRNSELFHHPACKSVKRINAENITAFSSAEQAMEEGFKPCRACCSHEMIKTAVPGLFTHRRVSAV